MITNRARDESFENIRSRRSFDFREKKDVKLRGANELPECSYFLGSANPLQFHVRIFMGISSFRVIKVRVWFIGNSINALSLIIRKLSDEDYNFVSSAESGLPYIFHIRLFWFADWIDTNICDCLIFHCAYLLFISWSYV